MLAYVEGYFAGICIMGYDLILRGGLPAGLGVICYGDIQYVGPTFKTPPHESPWWPWIKWRLCCSMDPIVVRLSI